MSTRSFSFPLEGPCEVFLLVTLTNLVPKWKRTGQWPCAVIVMDWNTFGFAILMPLKFILRGTLLRASSNNYSHLYARVISHEIESSDKRSFIPQPSRLQFTNATINFSFSNDEGYITCSSWNRIMCYKCVMCKTNEQAYLKVVIWVWTLFKIRICNLLFLSPTTRISLTDIKKKHLCCYTIKAFVSLSILCAALLLLLFNTNAALFF